MSATGPTMRTHPINEKRSETIENDVLRLGDKLVIKFHLLMKLFQVYGSKNVPLHTFIQECIQIINTLVEREERLSLKILHNDFFLNGQRLHYSVQGFASFRNLLTQWTKRLIGEVIFRGLVDERILREFIYNLINLEEGKEDNAYLLIGKLVSSGISSVEVEPLESFEGDGEGDKKEEKEGLPPFT